jgi:hypothetical protein
MQIDDAAFHPPFEGADPAYVLRIEVTGSDFEYRAAPVVARVGAVPVEALVVDLEGTGFVGQLRSMPQTGDELEVGYEDGELIKTGLTFDPPIG